MSPTVAGRDAQADRDAGDTAARTAVGMAVDMGGGVVAGSASVRRTLVAPIQPLTVKPDHHQPVTLEAPSHRVSVFVGTRQYS